MADPYDVPQGSNESNYDITTLIAMDGTALSAAVQALKTQCTNVADSVSAINTALGTLQLGWAGATEQEATDFINRWNAAAVSLFGTDAAADDNQLTTADGVLNVMVSGLLDALAIYEEAETEVLANFTQMFTSLTPSTADDSPSTGDNSNPAAGSDPVIVS